MTTTVRLDAFACACPRTSEGSVSNAHTVILSSDIVASDLSGVQLLMNSSFFPFQNSNRLSSHSYLPIRVSFTSVRAISRCFYQKRYLFLPATMTASFRFSRKFRPFMFHEKLRVLIFFLSPLRYWALVIKNSTVARCTILKFRHT